MTDKLIWKESHPGVIHLVLNSPDNLNAMDLDMAHAFRKAKERLEQQTDLRAIVISAVGRAFSAGGDLEMLRRKAENTIEQNCQDMIWFYHSFLGLRELCVPLICVLKGHAVGAGFCFASACDIRIADSTCKLSAPFTRLALHPGMGGSYFLPKAFGSEVARDLMLTGRRMLAEEALQRGYLHSVCEPEQLDSATETLVLAVLKSAPEATKALLTSERNGERDEVEQRLQREALEQAHCYARDEFKAGIVALQNRQSPPWSAQA